MNSNEWVTFEYHITLIRKVTNTFKHPNLCITYRVDNAIHNLLEIFRENINKYSNSGIYILRCDTCDNVYVDHTGGTSKQDFWNIIDISKPIV
jgi:hypothetical protein